MGLDCEYLDGGPSFDELEVTLIGPGWGECVVIHFGGNKWGIVDSCLDNTLADRPVGALSYLERIGVDVESAVRFVLCSHWHDDHIAGLGEIILKSRAARICCSLAFKNEEFHEMVRAYQKGPMMSAGSGVAEIDRIFAGLRADARAVTLAIQNRPVFSLSSDESGHGHGCTVWALSPSDKQVARFLASLSIPRAKETKSRSVPIRANHQSVVLWVEVGETRILLGGDLEETKDPDTGWSVLLSSSERPKGKAAVFKIPHHGSENGDNEQVWLEMLIEEPIAILTPWNRGSGLPRPSDMKRISGRTPHAYSTAPVGRSRSRRRHASVEKTLREAGIVLRTAEPRTGMLRLRKKLLDDWKIELAGGACALAALLES